MHLLLALIALVAASAEVCAPAGCLAGNSTSQLLASNGTTYITPGVHNFSLRATSHVNQTISQTSDSTTVLPPPKPLIFPRPFYVGEPGSGSWESLYLPPKWYALIGGHAIWGAVPDRGELAAGEYDIETFGSVCLETCSRCDDGLEGSGYCLGPSGPEACNCVHGSCGTDDKCTCSAGWKTDPTQPKQCNTCVKGFYLTSNGGCAVCPAGCTECVLSGSQVEPMCTACAANMNLNQAVPSRCQPLSPCAAREYYDLEAFTCNACSGICDSCTGPTFNDCTTCVFPRAMLKGKCEYMEAQSGVCDSSLTKLDGTFVRSKEKGICDSCPVGCKKCHLPEWNLAKPWGDIACTVCQDGYILQDNACVKECTAGSFWSSNNGTSGTCRACDAACKTCIGNAEHCTSCAAGPVFNGTCVDSCPENTHLVGTVCLACHPDCQTCSAPGVDQCLTCPPGRPVLSNGRCIPFCSPGTVLEQGSCRPCGGNCTSCLSSGCTACVDDFFLSAGVCSPAACEGPFASGLGVCLSAFVQTTTSNPNTSQPKPKSKSGNLLWLAGVGSGLALLLLGAAWFVRRERRRTRDATTEFARQMDDQSVRKRLARLFGYNEPRPRLREFRLGPRAARSRMPRASDVPDVRKSPRTPPPKKTSVDAQWVNPPPPYAPRNRPTSPGFVNIPLEPLSLPPPPRASPVPIRIPDQNLTAQGRGLTDAVPLSPEAIRELGELWPHLGRRCSHGIV
ncbi:hypothetical protein CspHIS471_0300120 [Cutaneotrichosporon sp. HIS471]|nr:hypothetical protein CspHIS471_0300120 [Cutaneotrichosporon sp. HIS471]